MKTKYTFFVSLLMIVSTIFLSGFMIETNNDEIKSPYINKKVNNLPTSVQMYDLIEYKSIEYNIPKYILYNISWLETGYRGPFHWNYNPYVTSYAGATGPMQIIPQHFSRQYATDYEIKTNIEKNVDVSCKMLVYLYKSYGKWDIVLGAYNTGSLIVNDYARYGVSNRNYQSKWIKL
jgi:soluble lytic murein transglycosylase-like protein